MIKIAACEQLWASNKWSSFSNWIFSILSKYVFIDIGLKQSLFTSS